MSPVWRPLAVAPLHRTVQGAGDWPGYLLITGCLWEIESVLTCARRKLNKSRKFEVKWIILKFNFSHKILSGIFHVFV